MKVTIGQINTTNGDIDGNVAKIPDPRDPENLFKASGRGVLIIHNIMDAVQYNERGNRITMIKKTEKEKNQS